MYADEGRKSAPGTGNIYMKSIRHTRAGEVTVVFKEEVVPKSISQMAVVHFFFLGGGVEEIQRGSNGSGASIRLQKGLVGIHITTVKLSEGQAIKTNRVG